MQKFGEFLNERQIQPEGRHAQQRGGFSARPIPAGDWTAAPWRVIWPHSQLLPLLHYRRRRSRKIPASRSNRQRFAAACRIFSASRKSSVSSPQPDAATPLGLRDKAMIELMYSTGLARFRTLRLARLRHSNESGCLRCIGKGNKERVVPVGRKALDMIQRYLKESRPKLCCAGSSPFLFLNQQERQDRPHQGLENTQRIWRYGWFARTA